jgi:hypothetical protein
MMDRMYVEFEKKKIIGRKRRDRRKIIRSLDLVEAVREGRWEMMEVNEDNPLGGVGRVHSALQHLYLPVHLGESQF